MNDKSYSLRKLILVTVCMCFTSMPLFAQSTNPAWLDQLEDQLAKEMECKADYYIKVREGELGGRPFQEARVQCRDGRQFDADRIDPEPLFTITKCKPVVC